jgi:hypothetical protein
MRPRGVLHPLRALRFALRAEKGLPALPEAPVAAEQDCPAAAAAAWHV